ncbi:hypothetical protein VNO78_03615 [Psophocarpus tetragonolobus]|uniref:Uncharacterized protein n=1 Tax=Psophocarpus tetragonolobus TaxID=3891 RepID=A0AAN9TDJ6_PSOTE
MITSSSTSPRRHHHHPTHDQARRKRAPRELRRRGSLGRSFRILVNHALKLPKKFVSGVTSIAMSTDLVDLEESIIFVEELVYTWMVLHNDTSIMSSNEGVEVVVEENEGKKEVKEQDKGMNEEVDRSGNVKMG